MSTVLVLGAFGACVLIAALIWDNLDHHHIWRDDDE